ncbi:hypothetical protein K505DRAFT_328365 [Melanomma pulvis-pyrius CBS 109.77]|uniref:Uncharacterized protein n=1 Tax=Melanomma pulvis-pyrius CBS 109.77 TaxID=1314802 RepID=A0A6A6WYR7_9PLEO|nr:hypothetical protein K505DRAFT_328365 [Melanomma pulvis-pyrius CBS 109.77]
MSPNNTQARPSKSTKPSRYNAYKVTKLKSKKRVRFLPTKPFRNNAYGFTKPKPKKRVHILPKALVFLAKTPAKPPSRVTHNSTTRLLSLPPELRNKIFALALGSYRLQRSEWGPPSGTFYAHPGASRQPVKWINRCALLRVCRQIYSETATLPYRLNCFSFGMGTPELAFWIRKRSAAQLAAVRTLAVPFSTIRLEPQILDVLPNLKTVIADEEVKGAWRWTREEWAKSARRFAGRGVKVVVQLHGRLETEEPLLFRDSETGAEITDVFDSI